ncbi:MAG: glycosyl hydrolase family 32 [Kiritimatiellia bacterium]|jgi:hypothetical protein|nr:glycosyl hydrolase family 32 [Kiritimatiellia bacterium]
MMKKSLTIAEWILLLLWSGPLQAQWHGRSLPDDGERLYNGIRLPTNWPPQTVDAKNTSPMAVPYLTAPPEVIPIDVGRQLFVDDFLIATTTLRRVFGMPEKYAGNPVLRPETEIERNGIRNAAAIPKGGGLWWDPHERIFKLWYEAGWIHTVCYATSTNGLDWIRPALNVVPGTNQVLPPDLTPDSWTVVPDWETSDPMQRYKMFLRGPGGNIPGVSMTSADGIHWINRVITGKTGDRSSMFYNPFRRKWIYSLRASWRGRSRNYRECDSFLRGAAWNATDTVRWLAVDEEDSQDPVIQRVPQLYNFDAVAYESLMLGAFEIHHGPENGACMKVGLPKITELNFAYSRDGFHWSRPDRRAHIRAERWSSGKWDTGYVQSLGNLCTIQHDRLWFYYSGFQGDTNRLSGDWLQNGMYHNGAMGIALLRRDGFAAMTAEDVRGELVTRPLLFSGACLFVNADCPQGELRVEIQEAESGAVLPGYALTACRPVAVDSTLHRVTWQNVDHLRALRGKPVRFRFALSNGALYAFWVSRDATGRSDGYVAGGGPGYTGSTDTVGASALNQANRTEAKK